MKVLFALDRESLWIAHLMALLLGGNVTIPSENQMP